MLQRIIHCYSKPMINVLLFSHLLLFGETYSRSSTVKCTDNENKFYLLNEGIMRGKNTKKEIRCETDTFDYSIDACMNRTPDILQHRLPVLIPGLKLSTKYAAQNNSTRCIPNKWTVIGSKKDTLTKKKTSSAFSPDSVGSIGDTAKIFKSDSLRSNIQLNSIVNSIMENLNNSTSRNNNFSGIDGLIVDETDSKIGHDFYDSFYAAWIPPVNARDYTITISEKPLPRLGTQITISINDNSIYKKFVQPAYEIIQEMAQEGASIAYSYLEHYTQIQKELEGEDLQGTGIY